MTVPRSLVQVIRAHAAAEPGKTAFIMLAGGEQETSSATYGDLDRHARSLAARLQAGGLAGELRCSTVPGQASVRMFIRKGTGSSAE